MEKRYQFLAIAPSQGIGQRIEEMAAEMPDVEMRVFVGSLGCGHRPRRHRLYDQGSQQTAGD